MSHVITTLCGLGLGLLLLSSSPVRAAGENQEMRPRSGIIQYALENSEFNIFTSQCFVGRFREVNTLISPGLTDGFSEYVYIPFKPDEAVKIEADLPFALMSVWTSYTSDSIVIKGLADFDLLMKDGGPNPYVSGNSVMTSNRAYTIYAGKNELVTRFFKGDYDEEEDWENVNYLTTDSGESETLSILILRVLAEYGDASGLSSGEWIPKVTLFDENGNQEYCNFVLDQGGLPTINIGDTYANPNGGLLGKCFLFDADGERDFSFYPLAETKVAGLANLAYGAYVIALPQKELKRGDSETSDTAGVVVEFKMPPRVFDPEADDIYDDTVDARYTSICLYVSTGLGNKCILGTDIYNMWERYGVAYTVFGPADQEEYFKEKGIPFIPTIPEWKYLLYRVQLANEEFDLDINLPKWDTECNANVTNGYFKADNVNNLGDKAPVGLTCSKDKLLVEGCGFAGLNEILQGTRRATMIRGE